MIKLNAIRDESTRVVELVVDGAPNITPEQSYVKFTVRPSMLTLSYAASGLDSWKLASVTVTGRSVSKDGTVNLASRRTHLTTYTDLTGKGGTQVAKTPKWVVDLAAKYGGTPDELPRS